jgi:hypothetical protein
MDADRKPDPLLPLPCLDCTHPRARDAMLEVVDAYVRCRLGGQPPPRTTDGLPLPQKCCRRRMVEHVDIETLVT